MDCNLSRCRNRRLNHMRHHWIRDSYFPRFRKEQLGLFLCLLQQHSCYRLTDCCQFHLFPIKRHLVMSNVRLQDHIQMQLDRNLLNWLKFHLVQHHKWMIRFLFLHLKEEIYIKPIWTIRPYYWIVTYIGCNFVVQVCNHIDLPYYIFGPE